MLAQRHARAAATGCLSVAASPQLRRCSCDQLGLDCGYAGPTIAGVEAAVPPFLGCHRPVTVGRGWELGDPPASSTPRHHRYEG
eukprot:scaffold36833_cov100-Phaeocystis_antarctica.AAC.1